MKPVHFLVALMTVLGACHPAPKAAWTAPRPANTDFQDIDLCGNWVLLSGKQLQSLSRNDGQAGFVWPETSRGWIDAMAVTGSHAAFRSGGKLSIVDPGRKEPLFEDVADGGPFEAGGRFYWAAGTRISSWDPAQGSQALAAELGQGMSLHGVAVKQGTLLLGVRRQSNLQVTLNQGLVLGGMLLALNADGSERWRFESLPYKSPLIDGGTVYLVDSDVLAVGLHALDLSSGAVRWKRRFGNVPSDPAKAARTGLSIPATPQLSVPLLLDGRLILSVNDGDGERLLALNPADGSDIWVWDPLTDILDGVGEDGPAFSAPAQLQGNIVLGVGARMRQISAQGKPQWSVKAGSPLARRPAVDEKGWAFADKTTVYYFENKAN